MCLAIPGRVESVVQVDELTRTGTISFAGVLKEVNLSFLPDSAVGEYVLVHAGFALSKIDEEEAAKVFEYIKIVEEAGEGGA